jgi:hypothetical protein
VRPARARILALAGLVLSSTACLRQDTNAGVIIRPSAQATASPIAAGVYAVGATVRRPTGNTVAVLRYQGPFAGPSAGVRVVAAEIEGCANPNAVRSVRIATENFELEMADKTRRPVTDGTQRSPQYEGKALKPGNCEKGWLHFEIRSDEKPAFVLYDVKPPIRWKVG